MKKKIVLLVALASITCTFSACSNKVFKEKNKSSKSETFKISTETSDITKSNRTTSESDQNSYEDVIMEFIQAYLDNDREKTFIMQNPDGIMDIIDLSLKAQYNDEITKDEYIYYLQIKLYQDYDKHGKVTVKRLISAEPIFIYDELELRKAYGKIQALIDFTNENGGCDNIVPEKFLEALNNIDEEKAIEDNVLTEGYSVMMEIEYENGETSQGQIMVFRINDGDWKVVIPYGADNRIKFVQET
jgi:hypothetical protein